jgi:hypothetical protein
MLRPQSGHLQVLQFSHILLPNCKINILIFINGSYKLVPTEFYMFYILNVNIYIEFEVQAIRLWHITPNMDPY